MEEIALAVLMVIGRLAYSYWRTYSYLLANLTTVIGRFAYS